MQLAAAEGETVIEKIIDQGAGNGAGSRCENRVDAEPAYQQDQFGIVDQCPDPAHEGEENELVYWEFES
jgi:hypothetical protein